MKEKNLTLKFDEPSRKVSRLRTASSASRRLYIFTKAWRLPCPIMTLWTGPKSENCDFSLCSDTSFVTPPTNIVRLSTLIDFDGRVES